MLSATPAGGPGGPSAYAAGELARIEYMLEATPATVAALREHSAALAGTGAGRAPGDPGVEREIRRELRVLAELERGEAVVGEPPLLGATGIEDGGELHNADSLRHHRCLAALRLGSVLAPFDGGGGTAWQIGGGWGGFAYRFKTRFPDATYVITDHPLRFLFSATYLLTAIPEASVAFYEDGSEIAWEEHDFVFVPSTALDAIPESPDLAISIHSLEEMTGPQAASHVAHAYRRGCRFLYSYDRDRAPGNSELKNAHNVIERYFWPHDVPVPRPKQETGGRTTDRNRARHVIGWRRLKT